MSLESNIWKIKVIYFFSSLFFSAPVAVLFWIANGLSLMEIAILQSVFSITIVILELPTGYFADIYGRKTSLVVGSLANLLATIVYALGHSFLEFLLGEILWAVAVSFFSGAQLALLYDTLKNLGKEKLYKKISGSAMLYSFIAAIISSVAGGFIGKINLRLTFYACIPFFFALIPLSLGLKEPKIRKRIVKGNYAKEFFSTIKTYIINHSGIRAVIIYSAVVVAFTQASLWFYQPYFKLCGVDVVYFGIIFALFNIVAALSSKYAYFIEENVGKWKSVVSLPFLLSLSYFLLGNFVFYFSFTFAFIHQFIRGFSRPVITEYINSLTPSKARATVLSAESMVSRIFYASVLPLIGYLADIYTLPAALLVLGAVTLITGSSAILILRKVNCLNFSS